MDETINIILNGVNYVPKCGNPGSLIVFESNAYPILTGEDTSSVLFAAAEYGNGRIFVVSHDAYLENFSKYPNEFGTLWSNIKSWLTKNKSIDDSEIKNIEDYETPNDILPSIKLMKWIGTHNKTELFISQFLKKYIANGGSLICGICPWGWLNMSHGKTLEDMSLNKFLSLTGISFTADLCKISSNFIDVRNNLARYSHFGNAINLLEIDMNKAKDLENLLIDGVNNLQCSLASKHLEKLYQILYNYIVSKYKPTYKTKVTCPVGRALLSICSRVYQKSSSCEFRMKAPNIEEFPGSYYNLANIETVSVILTIKSKFDEFNFTGYYIAPGSLARITVLEGNPSGWEVRIGCHTDDLTDMEYLRRWPVVCSNIKLKRTTSITSAFGGLIYLDSPKGNSTIKIKLESVIEAPYFDLNKPETIDKWMINSQSQGLWAELSGKHITFNVPTNSIRNLYNPAEALKIWDAIVISNHALRGTDASSTWRERVVVDIQPYGGLIHSGYPVVIPYGYINSFFDKEEIVKTGWNIIHELGHCMQRSFWTPKGVEEVMANIFTLHAFETVFNQKAWNTIIYEKLNEELLNDFASKNFPFNEWIKNPSLGLLLFGQLVNSFGWNSFRIIFREYETLSNNMQFFKNDIDKWDQWICRFSNIVGLNVTPLFYFWGIEFSEKPGTSLSDLTPWLPNDEITRMFPDRIKYVRKNYNYLLVGNESMYTNFPKE